MCEKVKLQQITIWHQANFVFKKVLKAINEDLMYIGQNIVSLNKYWILMEFFRPIRFHARL